MPVPNEIRHAVRRLLRRPGFTAVAAITLALGIAANVAIFAVVNAVLLRPLPYPESERIVEIEHHAPGLDLPELENSPGTLNLYVGHARALAHVAGVQEGTRNLTGGLEPARIRVAEITPSWFDVMQVQPARGRRFVPADADTAAAPVAILAHTTWQTHFGGRPDVVGTMIELDGELTEIIGVMPAASRAPDPEVGVLLPYWLDPNGPIGRFGISGLARLAPGVTLEAARAEITQLQQRLPELSNNELTADVLVQAGWRASVETLRDRMVGDIRTVLWIVLGTVGFLLLVACASVANLFLVRAESRQRESGLRLALGASRRSLAASFLSESMLLGLAGGVLGMLLAVTAVRGLVAAAPAQLPRLDEIGVDWTVLLFAFVLSTLAGVLFGLLPLPQQLRSPLSHLVRDGRGSAGRDRQRVRKLLIVGQLALALVLLTGSTLMLRSFQHMRAVDPGIRPDGVLAVGISTGDRMPRAEAARTYERIGEEVRALPGVTHVGIVNALPLDPDGLNGGSFDIESRPRAEDALPPVAMFTGASPGYFEAIGTAVLAGRTMERADLEADRAVVWVSEGFARDHLDGNALGERIRFDSNSDWLEVVGVVRDVHTFGVREEVRPMAYLPMTQPVGTMQIGAMNLVVRTSGDPVALAPSVRAVVQRVDPRMPLTTARTMRQVVDESMADTAFTTTILMVAAAVALLLGAIGLYGVIGYVVSQRTQEIGVRIALGASPREVRALVLRQGVGLAVIGIAAGLAGAFALTRLLESLLFDVDRLDPVTFAVVPAVLLGVSVLAVYVPARRASTVSPLQALRSD